MEGKPLFVILKAQVDGWVSIFLQPVLAHSGFWGANSDREHKHTHSTVALSPMVVFSIMQLFFSEDLH